MKKAKENEVLYHIGLSKKMIEHASYAVLIDDKKYIKTIAGIIDPKAYYINENREFFSFLGELCSKKILIISTGLGSPAMGIAMEELATIGLKKFIRLGACGALQPYIKVGDLVLSKASMRLENTSQHYAPENYPAVASIEMTNTFLETLKYHNLDFHYGITATTDTFWPAQGRKDGFSKYVPIKFQNIREELRHMNILSLDMELSTIYTLCNVFKLEAVAVLDVINRTMDSDKIYEIDEKKRICNWEKFLKDAIKADIYRRET